MVAQLLARHRDFVDRAGHQPDRRRPGRCTQPPPAQARRIGEKPMSTADTPLLTVHDLTIALPTGGDRAYAVKDSSFEVYAREIVCIVGESGSGKSLPANAIMGLLPAALTPESGAIMFDNKDLLKQDEPTMRALRGKDIGMIFQEPLSALNPVMTVGR